MSVEAARKLAYEWSAAWHEGREWSDLESLAQTIAAHTEAALVADRLARHDETVAVIEAAVKEKEAPTVRYVFGTTGEEITVLVPNDQYMAWLHHRVETERLMASLAAAESTVNTLKAAVEQARLEAKAGYTPPQ